jgi:hypothetical protein
MEPNLVLRRLDVSQPNPFLRLWDECGLGGGGGGAPLPTPHHRSWHQQWQR